MNDESRKRLTLYLGECWHDFEFWNSGVSNICKHCKGWLDWNEKDQEELRLQRERKWDTWTDLGALKGKLVEKGEWEEFLKHAFNSSKEDEEMSMFSDEDVDGENTFYDEDFIKWLLDPTRFCELVDKWLEGK